MHKAYTNKNIVMYTKMETSQDRNINILSTPVLLCNPQ